MSSTCFELECSSSGRRSYIQLWYGTFYVHISISSLVGRRVYFEHTLLPTRPYIASSWPSNIHALCISFFFSYLLLVGLYYLFFTITITEKRKIHSSHRCTVFSFPAKNYLFYFCHKFSTRPLWAFVCLEHLWSWRREQKEQKKNKNFGQGELQTLHSLRGNEILRKCQFRHSPRLPFSSILGAR